MMSVALFAAGALSVVGYSYITREAAAGDAPSAQTAHQRAMARTMGAADENTAVTAATPPSRVGGAQGDGTQTGDGPVDGAAAGGASVSNPNAAAAVSPQAVASWIAQATGADDSRRSAAIEALASAPKADAVPVLAQVLETAGESDRPRVLQSLRTLARQQGDADDHIRSVVRKVAFHDSDETAVQSALETLDDIERDLSQANSTVRR